MQRPARGKPTPAPAPRYTGDLPVLQERGVLRVIVPPEPVDHLPRSGERVTLDYDIAHGLSETLKLKLELVKAGSFAEMMAKLLEGEGDIVAASLTITPQRQEKAAFSVPYLHVDEYLVTKAGGSLPGAIQDLAEMEIGVRRSSSHYQTLVDLQQQVPSLRIHEAPEQLGLDLLVEGVLRGDYEATVSDEHLWGAVSRHYPNMATPLVLAEGRPIALMMRPGDARLKTTVDEYLLARRFSLRAQDDYTDDLPGLKERGRLRMLTRNNPLTYFIHRGRQVGFEYGVDEGVRRPSRPAARYRHPRQPRRPALLPERRQGRPGGCGHDHHRPAAGAGGLQPALQRGGPSWWSSAPARTR